MKQCGCTYLLKLCTHFKNGTKLSKYPLSINGHQDGIYS